MRYKKAGVLLESAEQWALERDGFDSEGKWDCIFRSALGAIAYNDEDLLTSCWFYLRKRRRWPRELDHALDWQDPKRMTRDPYIMYYCAEFLVNESIDFCRRDIIRGVKIPFRLYSPSIWAWRRYLITGKGKKWWEFLELINLKFSHKVFALHLLAWRAYAAESDRVKRAIWPHIPIHNTLLKALCRTIYTRESDDYYQKALDEYQPRIRNYFTAEYEEAVRLPFSDKDEEYKLDLDILKFVITSS